MTQALLTTRARLSRMCSLASRHKCQSTKHVYRLFFGFTNELELGQDGGECEDGTLHPPQSLERMYLGPKYVFN